MGGADGRQLGRRRAGYAMMHPYPWRINTPLSRRQLVWLAAGAACKAAGTNQQRIPPADEAARDPDLAALLHKMRSLAAQRDSNGLEALMLPTFKVEFDAGKGAAAFRRRWHLESNSSKLWGVLDRLFALGGTFYTDTLFALPYVYTKFLSGHGSSGTRSSGESRRTSCGQAGAER